MKDTKRKSTRFKKNIERFKEEHATVFHPAGKGGWGGGASFRADFDRDFMN